MGCYASVRPGTPHHSPGAHSGGWTGVHFFTDFQKLPFLAPPYLERGGGAAAG